MPWRVELDAEKLKREKKDKNNANKRQQDLLQFVKGKDPKPRSDQPKVPE